MTNLILIQNPSYKIVRYKDSNWVRVVKDKEFLALVMDKESAYQVIYSHINDNSGQCDRLTKKDFTI
jgi:hypothetical protein